MKKTTASLIILMLAVTVMGGCAVSDPAYASLVNGVQLQDENGDSYGIVQVDGKPRVVCTPYTYQIAEGAIADHSAVRRFGMNDDVGAAWETVYTLSDLYTYLTAAEQLKIKSSSLSDNITGTGARTLFIQGLDGNYNRISETINLAGTSYVTTTKSYLRCYMAYVVTSGAIGSNAGNIEIWNNAEAHQLDELPLGDGQLHTAGFTVPAGTTFYATDYFFGEATNNGMIFSLWIREYGKSWRLVREYSCIQNNHEIINAFPFPLPEKTDVELRVRGLATGGTAVGGFNGWYEAN